MRESTFVLIFLPLFIAAFVPGLFNSIVTLPGVVLYKLVQRYQYQDPGQSQCQGQGQCQCHPASSHHLQQAIDAATAAAAATSMSWFQKQLHLPARSRGSFLITAEVEDQLPEIGQYRVGILHLFLQHTSAALSLNENWDDDVRADMSDALDRIVPEDGGKKGNRLYRHSAEGPDDMPAHVKSALIGASVSVPIANGRLATGTWQGIWMLEFRSARHSRKVLATIQGEKM